MTYNQYIEELRQVWLEIAILKHMISYAPQNMINDIRRDVNILLSYRGALAAWFWGSRVGNPPTYPDLVS